MREREPAQVVFPGFGGSGWSLMMLLPRRPSFASMRNDSTTSAPASSSRNAKHADVSKTSASATPTVLRPAGERGFGQSAAREHAACGANRVVGRRVGTSGTPPSLDLLPDGLKFLRRQRPDLIQYGLGLRAHGFNLTCSP